MEQDSLGKTPVDSSGPYATLKSNGFTYLDYMNNVQTWIPKPNVSDTITIECYSENLELSTNNFFTAIKQTFLVKNGDTVVFNFKDNIPKANITNRTVNDIEINYNNFRHQKLFQNKYSSHYLVFGNMFLNENISEYPQKSLDYYDQAQKDYEREMALLDSLHSTNSISEVNYSYRKDALDMLMESHKKLKNIKVWLAQHQSLQNNETIEPPVSFDLSQTDSLLKFSFFREYLNNISQYDLELINETNTSSGSAYIDTRIRFDSIVQDKRFNQTAKNHLLFNAYQGIGDNFKVKDKELYFKKLQEYTTNRAQLNKVVEEYKLDFDSSDQLILTNIQNDTTTFASVLKHNQGKWLYVDFWASWCAPCLRTMPASNQLRKELDTENIAFIYLALNDTKVNWKKAVQTYQIPENQNYFIENSNVSKVIEDLHIKTIPHYLIYNPNGELVNGYANRPGEGAKEQLQKLITD